MSDYRVGVDLLTLNCMLGKNCKTLYNCNCFSVVVNVFVKGG